MECPLAILDDKLLERALHLRSLGSLRGLKLLKPFESFFGHGELLVASKFYFAKGFSVLKAIGVHREGVATNAWEFTGSFRAQLRVLLGTATFCPVLRFDEVRSSRTIF